MNRSCDRLACGFPVLFVLLAAIGPLAALAADEPAQPAVWICPPGQDQGAVFRSLFAHPEQWEQTRASIDGLFHASGFLARNFSDDELRGYFAQLREWKLKFGLEVGAIKPHAVTGEKGFQNEVRLWERFERQGAKIEFLAMDEPLICTRLFLHKPDDYAVQETANYIALVRKKYPHIQLGDIEGYPAIPSPELLTWIDTLQARLKQMNVRGLDFVRLDVDWCHFILGNSNWREVKLIEQACKKRKLRFSLIYWAADQPHMQKVGLADDATWYVSTLQQGYDYAFLRGAPDEYVIQSWVGAPSRAVPETDPWTFTRSVLDFTRKFVPRGK